MQIEHPASSAARTTGRALDLPASPIVLLSPPASIPRTVGAAVRRWTGPVAIALILFELAVRTLIYSPRPQVFDPLLGEIPAPGSTWINGREGYGHIHWNRQGIRGRDLPTTPSVHRIIVMGDSFTEAEGVNDDQTFCARLENNLARRLHQEVWVGNCGRPGLDASDLLYYLPAYQKKFHPELTVLVFNLSDFRVSGGKISGMVAHFDPAAPPGRGLVADPLSDSKEHDLLDMALPGPLQGAAHLLVDHSGLAIYGAARLYALHWRKWPKDKFITHQEQIATVSQMERYLGAMLSLSKTPIACAFIAPWNSLWTSNNHWDQIMDERLRTAAGQLNIPFIDTGPTFHRCVDQTGQPANGFYNTEEGPGFSHLSPEGHRIVAEVLAPPLARIISQRVGPHMLHVARLRAHAAGVDGAPGLITASPASGADDSASGGPVSGTASS